ncbi:Major facilitator super [Chamberlinius hualienensis]
MQDTTMASNKTASYEPKNIALLLILIVFIDTIGVATVIIQLMPRLIKLGATPFAAGCIGAVYGAVQLFSSPLVGNLGDKKDRKYILLISILLSSVGYFLLGFPNLLIITISRILSGLTKHTHSLSMAGISSIIKPEDKGKYFGLFGGGIGAGFIIGPVAGGFLSALPNGFQVMSYVTISAFLLNAFIIWKFLPEMKVSSEKNKKTKETNGTIDSDGRLRYYMKNLGIENCWDVFVMQGLLEIGMMVNLTHIALIIEEDYGLQSKDFGIFVGCLSLVAVISAATSSKVTELFGLNRITWMLYVITLVGYTIQSFRPTFKFFVAVMILTTFSSTILRNGWANLATMRSPPEKSGKVIGFMHSVVAVAGMLAPVFGGIATQLSGTCHTTTIVTTFFILMGAISCIWYPRPVPKTKRQ